MKKFRIFTPALYLFLLSCSTADNQSIPQPSGGRGGGAPIAGTTSYSISVTVVGAGSVTSDFTGINCGTTCSAIFSGGNSVTLTATPQTGSTFIGWSGDCSGTAPCTLLMNSNKTVTATFISGNAQSITSIDGGRNHTCGLILRSMVACWGNNANGQLGDGTYTSSLKPKILNLQISSVDLVTAGDDHTCLLASQGTIQCWGLNNYGQLGNGTTAGNSNQPVTVTGLNYPIGLSAGGAHTCGLNADGSVLCWGLNNSGQLGNGTFSNSSNPGLVFGTTSSVSSTVTSISAGANHTCGLMSDGSVICWGSNQFGQLGDGSSSSSSNKPVSVTGLSGATAISSGVAHTCALISDGTVKCWGSNSSGQLGNGASVFYSTIPVSVTGLSTATAVSSGRAHTCALISDGTVQCWGNNDYGQLGNGNLFVSQTTPVPVNQLNTAVSIGTGLNHTCAVLSDQTVDCWGDNSSGQLGTGNTLSSSTPQPVSGL